MGTEDARLQQNLLIPSNSFRTSQESDLWYAHIEQKAHSPNSHSGTKNVFQLLATFYQEVYFLPHVILRHKATNCNYLHTKKY